MNLPVIFHNITGAIKSACGTGWLFAKKHAPEVMIGTGILGFGATIYETTKATNKTNAIIDNLNARQQAYITLCRDAEDAGDDRYTIDDLDADCKALRRRSRFAIIKAWTPVVTLGAGSVVCILGGYKIINGRYVATAAAYKVLEAQYDRYRENAVERFGSDVDWQLANDIKAERLEAAKEERNENDKIAEENKKKKVLKKKKPKSKYNDIHGKLFDPHSDRWQRYWTPDLMLEFLKLVNRQATDKLRLNGHFFENELNDMLGLPRTPEGQVLGWIYDKEHPNAFVDCGVDNMPEEEIRRIMSTHRNDDLYTWLAYNSMGIVYDKI